MSLKPLGFIDLPEHRAQGAFDHADVHRARGLLYVAHTANDAVDVIDLRAGVCLRSITGLTGVAGSLVCEAQNLVFTSNRGEDSVGIFSPDAEDRLTRIRVGVRPNGLAYDPGRGILLCANVGNPDVPGSQTVTLVDVKRRSVRATVRVPGRTRWAVYDPGRAAFFVNIADPACIVVVDADRAQAAADRIEIPDRGPHGLEIDVFRRQLFCACDGGKLVRLDSGSGAITGTLDLSGGPDVIFLNRTLQHLYVAIGDPGVIDVIDTAAWKRLETVRTEPGAHTLAIEETSRRVFAFLPKTHRAAVFEDRR